MSYLIEKVNKKYPKKLKKKKNRRMRYHRGQEKRMLQEESDQKGFMLLRSIKLRLKSVY